MERTFLSSKLDSGAGSCAFHPTCADIHRINHFSPASSPVGGAAGDHKSWRNGTTAKAGVTSPMTRQYHSSKGAPLEPDACTSCCSSNRVYDVTGTLDDHDHDHAKINTRLPTTTTSTKNRRPFVSHGEVSLQGCRRNMEDAVATVPGFWPGHGFFAVYDGHGGAEVAEACRNRMHVVLAEEMWKKMKDHAGGKDDDDGSGELLRRWWTEALEASFRAVDTEVLLPGAGGKAGSGKTTGSTAIVGVVGTRDIVVANCGDSRAVLCRAGEPVPLSYDHKPDRADELARIEEAGGRVINWGGHRVLGVLATSRSIGDHYLKPYVTPDPEVTVTPRTDRDEFLILATDGLWDTVSNEAACAVARRCLAGLLLPRWTAVNGSASGGTNAAEVAAVVLAELAMSRGSRDNVSVVVVELRKVTARRRKNAQVAIKRRNGDATSLSLTS